MTNSKHRAIVLTFAAAALVVGCKGQTPKGQVVATVYGKEITTRALQDEMGQVPSDPAIAKKVRDATLQRMVERLVLAHEAENRKLDKTPLFAVQADRATQQLKAALVEKALTEQTPAPAADEVQQFLSAHPKQFAERSLYVVDQVVALVPTPKMASDVAASTSFEQALQKLDQDNARAQRSMTVVDPLRTDPRAVDKLATLSPGQIFAMAEGNRVIITKLIESQPAPVSGPAAANVGGAILKQQRQQQAVQRQLKSLMDKAAGDIQYNTKAG